MDNFCAKRPAIEAFVWHELVCAAWYNVLDAGTHCLYSTGMGTIRVGDRRDRVKAMKDRQEGTMIPWDSVKLQHSIKQTFTDEALTYFCFDYFDAVFLTFQAQTFKEQKIQRLLDYCKQHSQVERLLKLLQDREPSYASLFQPGASGAAHDGLQTVDRRETALSLTSPTRPVVLGTRTRIVLPVTRPLVLGTRMHTVLPVTRSLVLGTRTRMVKAAGGTRSHTVLQSRSLRHKEGL